MPYRDEKEQLNAKVEQLEDELAAAHEKIAHLEGTAAAIGGDDDKRHWFSGTPARFRLERELPFEVGERGYEAIAEVLRARLPIIRGATIAQVGGTLTYRDPLLEVRISRSEAGHTPILIDCDQRDAGGLMVIGLACTSLLSLLVIAATLKGLGSTPAGLVIALPLVLIASYLSSRKLAVQSARTRREQLSGLFETIAAVAAKHAKLAPVRIAAPDAAGAGVEAPEAEAEETDRQRVRNTED